MLWLLNFLRTGTKEKTEFGYFLEAFDIKQEWIARKNKTRQNLISLLTLEHSRIPKPTTANKSIREFETNIKREDLW